jgi:hypothetical protein
MTFQACGQSASPVARRPCGGAPLRVTGHRGDVVDEVLSEPGISDDREDDPSLGEVDDLGERGSGDLVMGRNDVSLGIPCPGRFHTAGPGTMGVEDADGAAGVLSQRGPTRPLRAKRRDGDVLSVTLPRPLRWSGPARRGPSAARGARKRLR